MRRLVSAALVVAVAAALAPVAAAAPKLTPSGDASFPERSFVLTLPGETQARAGQISVTEDGSPVTGLDVEPVGAAQRARLGVILALDTSDSMRGEPVVRAFEAARAFAAERNENQPLGLVTFNSEATLAMPLTVDAFEIQEGLARPPETRPETHLYDAGLKAVDVIREANLPGGFVVVLSDGADYGSEATLATLANAAREANVRIYTVGLQSARFDPDALTLLAESAGGTYSEAGSPQDLSAIYSTLSAELSNAYLLSYRSAAEPRDAVAVTAKVQGVGSASTTYTSPRLSTSNPAGSGGEGWSSPGAVAAAVIIIASLFAIAIALVVRRRRKTARERVEEYVAPREAEPEGPSLTDRLASTTERSLSGAAWWGRFSEAVDIAAIELPPGRLLTNAFGIAAGGGLLLAAATGQLAVVIVCLALTPIALWVVVRTRVRKQRELFADQLADHLAVVGSTLRVGHSFPQAMATGLDEAPEPTRREFKRAVADERLGASLDEALEGVAQRMANRDVEQVALLALLQREAGADAAEMLDGVVETIRERQELRRTVKTLTAQGRLSRGILTGLPVVVLGILLMTNPDYIEPLYETGGGQLLSVFAVLSVIAGSLVIKRIVDFEI